MSDCDTTTGMCVGCIPDGDQGCRSGFDCCSGVCGAGTVCESTTTTTITSSTTTTTAVPCLSLTCTCDDGVTPCERLCSSDFRGTLCADYHIDCTLICAEGHSACDATPCTECVCESTTTTTLATPTTTTTL